MENTAKQTHRAPAEVPAQRRLLAPRLAGAALLVATAAIHLDLYLTGYKLIPTIGVLFLLQIVGGFLLAIGVLVTRGGLGAIVSFLGAGYMISTLAGYLVTMWVGLFGFQEVRTTAGLVAGVIEVAGFGIMGWIALAGVPDHGPLAPLARLRSALPGGHHAALSAASVVAAIVLGISLATATTAGAGATAAGDEVSSASAATSGPVLHMTMKNFKFFPANPEVQPGEKVIVTNFDAAPHSVTGGVPPKESGLFTTALLAQNQTGSFIAPKKAGMYPFYCIVHHFMVGILIVK
jgi:plastocyanin